jgi:hypothetical protein
MTPQILLFKKLQRSHEPQCIQEYYKAFWYIHSNKKSKNPARA